MVWSQLPAISSLQWSLEMVIMATGICSTSAGGRTQRMDHCNVHVRTSVSNSKSEKPHDQIWSLLHAKYFPYTKMTSGIFY